jgi:hypothetical protein
MADELHNHLLGLEKFNGKVIDLASASVTAMQSPHSSDSLKIFFSYSNMKSLTSILIF